MADYVFPPPDVVAVPVEASDALFPVRRVYCVGRNYLEHIREMGQDERAPPFFFQKPTDAVVTNGQVPYPPATVDFQFEVELVLSVGAGGSDIPVAEAASHVFGAAVGIDFTRRDLQLQAREAGRPWEPGKSFDHSAPIAPIVPLAGKLPEAGSISLSVNGETRQQSDLAQLIWSCAEVISHLSRQYRLERGDLIFTGTPAGVGPVERGDTVIGRVAGLPDLQLTVI